MYDCIGHNDTPSHQTEQGGAGVMHCQLYIEPDIHGTRQVHSCPDGSLLQKMSNSYAILSGPSMTP